jgi:hypothetical protein
MDTLPVECLQLIAGHLPEADRASFRASTTWLAWSLPVGVCFDLEARLRRSTDPEFWRWAFQHLNVDSLVCPTDLFHVAAGLGFEFALQALHSRVSRCDARHALILSACYGKVNILRYLHQAFDLTAD